MTDLIKRLEEVEKGSGAFDKELALLLGGYTLERRGKDRKEWFYPVDQEWFYRKDSHELPRYTTSIDAALALAERVLPEGWTVEIKSGARPFNRAIIHPKYTMENKQDRCPMGLSKGSPALALCIAILKATDTGRE